MNDKHVAYSAGVLKPSVHYQLVRNLRKFAETAGIPEELIYTPLEKNVSKREVQFMADQHLFFKNGFKGLLYSGDFDCSMLDRMSALVGCFVRNFMDAQVMLMSEVMENLKGGYEITATILAVPDFYLVGNSVGKKMFDADASMLLSFLFRRANAKHLTLIHIEDVNAFEMEFGVSFGKFIDTYQVIKPKDL